MFSCPWSNLFCNEENLSVAIEIGVAELETYWDISNATVLLYTFSFKRVAE